MQKQFSQKKLQKIAALPRKFLAHIKLMRQDPELFGRNLLQIVNPELFEQRLINVLHAHPMHIHFDPASDSPPRLNVLDSAWTKSGMTGGPNTAINLALRIAREGIAVRLVSTVQTSIIDRAWFQAHAASLLSSSDAPDMPIVSAAKSDHPLAIGPRDVFIATHWTTAQQLKTVLSQTTIKQFFYMLQEFEPGFYPWSSNYARAVETYDMDFWPIINEAMLAEYFFVQPCGRFVDPVMRDRAVIFEPAVDQTRFHADFKSGSSRSKRLLFYARPTNTRNMFGIGLMALRQVAADPSFHDWEFVAIGSPGGVPALQLGGGHVLRPVPWADYANYAEMLREADLLLCPMLSPHTSYPVLEMAACGGISITNTFVTKTRDALQTLSQNIIAVEPTVEGFADGMRRGALRINAAERRTASLNLPGEWETALCPAVKRIVEIFNDMQKAVVLP
jgi:hypothetical protein